MIKYIVRAYDKENKDFVFSCMIEKKFFEEFVKEYQSKFLLKCVLIDEEE